MNKYSFLNNEIIDNFFTSDIDLADNFIKRYDLDFKPKDVENYIYKYKERISIMSILHSKLKKLLFDKMAISSVLLSTRYYKKFMDEYYKNRK